MMVEQRGSAEAWARASSITVEAAMILLDFMVINECSGEEE